MSWFQTLLPVVTLIAGGLLQYLSQWGADARQRRAGREAYNRQLQERRENFELEHLLRLFDTLREFARATGWLDRHNMQVARKTGTYSSQELPADIEDQATTAAREVLGLMGLVLDPDLRALVYKAYAENRAIATMEGPVEEAEATMSRAMDAFSEAIDGIALRVRQIYLAQM